MKVKTINRSEEACTHERTSDLLKVRGASLVDNYNVKHLASETFGYMLKDYTSTFLEQQRSTSARQLVKAAHTVATYRHTRAAPTLASSLSSRSSASVITKITNAPSILVSSSHPCG